MITFGLIVFGAVIGGIAVAVWNDGTIKRLILERNIAEAWEYHARQQQGKLSKKIHKQRLQIRSLREKVEQLTPPEVKEAKKQYWIAKQTAKQAVMSH